MFESMKKKAAASRIDEEKLYEQVVKELANGVRRDGLWAKAIAHSNGQNEKAKSLYIQYRVKSLEDELNRTKSTARNTKPSDLEGSFAEGATSTWWIHALVLLITCLFLLVFFTGTNA